MRKRGKKWLAGLLAAGMTMGMLSGCGDSTAQTDSSQTGSQTEAASSTGELEPMEISVAIWGIQEGFDAQNAENDTIYQNLCDKFNITINPVGVTWNDYQEKNKVWAASGSLPDVFCDALVTDNNGLYQNWAKQGIIKEIPSDLSAYENLSTIMNMDSVKAVAIDGKQYMIPRGIDPSADAGEASGMSRAILYRKDWAAEAGYTEAPKTYDEFEAMLKAMKENHPEAAGLSANSIHYLSTLALDLYPELANEGAWVYDNDQWAPAFTSEKTVAYIERMQKLYQDGILDPDFMTQKDGDAIGKFQSGYACAILGGDFNPITFMEANPDVEKIEDAIGFIAPFAAEDGKSYVYTNTPYWSETYINASVDDAKLERILMVMDYLYSHEFAITMKNGIEGVDWEKKDGENVSLLGEDENLSDKYPIMNSLGWLASWFTGFEQTGDGVISNNPTTASYEAMKNEMAEYETENCEAAPINFDVFLMSNEAKTENANMGSDFVEKANNLIISGEDAEQGWKDIVSEMEGKGLNEAIESVTAQAKEEGITE